MQARIHTYGSQDILVEFEPARCIHAKECVHGLPEVFDPERRPWVEPSRARSSEVAEVVRRCPTGALRYHWRAGSDEQPEPRNTVRVVPSGPLEMRGHLRLHRSDGTQVEEMRAALCRCGASLAKPYCDGSHGGAGFEDDARGIENRLQHGELTAGAALDVRPAPNGPLLLEGPVTLLGADGRAPQGVGCALCRCGRSRTKPYCDGAHDASGFRG